jgi:hypothetical protein
VRRPIGSSLAGNHGSHGAGSQCDVRQHRAR